MFPEIFEALSTAAGWLPSDHQRYIKAIIVVCWMAVTRSTPIHLLDVIGAFSTDKVRSLTKGARVCNSIVKSTRTIKRVVNKPDNGLLSLFETMSLASASIKIAQNLIYFLPLGSTAIYKGMTLVATISSIIQLLTVPVLPAPSMLALSLVTIVSNLSHLLFDGRRTPAKVIRPSWLELPPEEEEEREYEPGMEALPELKRDSWPEMSIEDLDPEEGERTPSAWPQLEDKVSELLLESPEPSMEELLPDMRQEVSVAD